MTNATNTAHKVSAFNSANTLHKVLGAVAALAVTFVVQGSLLAGFENVSAKATAESPVANAKLTTLPTVTVLHGRG